MVNYTPTNPGYARDVGSIPGLGRSPGEGNGHPLQHSCLEKPIDRGAWQAIVHGVAKRWTQTEQLTLSLSFHFHLSIGKVVLTRVYLDQKQMERKTAHTVECWQPSATHKAENIFVGRMAEFFADLQHTYINTSWII